MRDLTGAPDEEVAAVRARVASEDWGAQLLAQQGADGGWGKAAWNRSWNSTLHILMLLRHLGLECNTNFRRSLLRLPPASRQSQSQY